MTNTERIDYTHPRRSKRTKVAPGERVVLQRGESIVLTGPNAGTVVRQGGRA